MNQTSQKTHWVRISGAGNSFLMTHFSKLPEPLNKQLSSFTRKVCREYRTDGLAILLPTVEQKWDLRWLFYNADGSTAEMCGNAACCAVIYAFEKKIVSKPSFLLKTLHHTLRGEIKNNKARVTFRQNFKVQGPFQYCFHKKTMSYLFINTSVPHAVIKRSQVPYEKKEMSLIKSIGKDLRHQTWHDKAGMNVSFYSETDEPQSISACTFERGVEDITSACGTGALAVCKAYQQIYPHFKHIRVQMPGGQLQVYFHDKAGKVSLESPAQWGYEINIPIS